MKKNHIVLTTVNYPKVLKSYYSNLEQSGMLEATKIWVVGDRKTPKEVSKLCAEITEAGLEARYLGIKEQDEWGTRFPEFYGRIPYDNEARRNIGYLHALEGCCERLISIDDDNWPTDDSFIEGHSVTGKLWNQSLVADSSGFYNSCEHLTFEPTRAIFPRGYPFALRNNRNNPQMRTAKGAVRIGVTSGLWLGEPDIDATTWLNGKVTSVSYTGRDLFVLDQDTWSPINTQNTSVTRELIPAFFCIPMGWSVPGGKIQRYGDIWGGYFLQALLQGTEFRVAFGRPLVDHRRNHHDYLEDLRHEFWGMVLTDWLLQVLREYFLPEAENICDRLDELSIFLADSAISKLPPWCPHEMKTFVVHTAENLSLWADVCRKCDPSLKQSKLAMFK